MLLQPNQYKELNENEKLNLFPHNFKSKIILNRCKRLPLDLPSWTMLHI